MENLFMRGFSPNFTDLIKSFAEGQVKEWSENGGDGRKKKNLKDSLNVYLKPVNDAQGNVVEFASSLVAIDQKGEPTQIETEQKTIRKTYSLPGGELQVEYYVYKDSETGKEVIRPKAWSGDDNLKVFVKDMAGIFTLLADILPIETMFRCFMEIDNLSPESAPWVGNTYLSGLAGYSTDVTGKLRPEELSTLLRYSRAQLIQAVESFKNLFTDALQAASATGIQRAETIVPYEAIIASKVSLRNTSETIIRDTEGFKPTQFQAKKPINLAYNATPNVNQGGAGLSFTAKK